MRVCLSWRFVCNVCNLVGGRESVRCPQSLVAMTMMMMMRRRRIRGNGDFCYPLVKCAQYQPHPVRYEREIKSTNAGGWGKLAHQFASVLVFAAQACQ